ncbi:MAG: hypothetical protein U0989_18825 [Azonexus sp.]|nr:hypothetical protein [Azonexus sp.]MDZ4316810.1 hypothetical protein [Azonexus sp.]
MKRQKSLAMLLVLLMLGISSAFAHGGRARVGVYVGPYWGPLFYPYPPQVIVVPAAPPPVYIEQREVPVEAAPAVQQYWYYCGSSQGYYPYVKECPDGWQKVLPQPSR